MSPLEVGRRELGCDAGVGGRGQHGEGLGVLSYQQRGAVQSLTLRFIGCTRRSQD